MPAVVTDERRQAEQQLAMADGPGWRSWDALTDALMNIDPPEELIRDENGNYWREVHKHLGPEGTIQTDDGQLVRRTVWYRRAVALSRRECLTALSAAPPVEMDFFDGVTWWRRGQKPERDLMIAQLRSKTPVERETLEPVGSSDQAQYQQLTVHAQAVKPVVRKAPVKDSNND